MVRSALWNTVCRAAVTLLAGAVSLPAWGQSSRGGDVDYESARRSGAAAALRADFDTCAEAYALAWILAPDVARAALASGEAGLCEEARGRPVAAYDYLRLAQEHEPAPASGGGQGAWKRYSAAVERLERRVARAIVVVSPSDAEVFLDGELLGSALSGRYVTLAPGPHSWVAKHAGHEDATFQHTVRGGDLPDVRLMLRRKPEEAAAPPCDAACRSAIRAEGAREGEAKARAEMTFTMQKHVQEAIDLIYRRRMDPSLSLIVGGALSAGLTLDVGPGFVVGGEARWRKFDEVGFSVGLEVQTLLPTKAVVDFAGQTVTVTQVVVAAVPCLQYKWFSGCAFGDVGMLIAGADGPLYFSGNGVLATAGFGPRLGFQIPFAERFMVRAFTELRISPVDTGWRSSVTAPGVEWGNPLVTGLFGLGVSFGEPVHRDP